MQTEREILEGQLQKVTKDLQKPSSLLSRQDKERLQERAAVLRREIAALDRAEAADLERSRAERDRYVSEDSAFWFRRFFTTLAIANAGGFAALSSGFLQAADRGAIARAVAVPMTGFAVGMVTAGAIPFFLWLKTEADLLVARVDAAPADNPARRFQPLMSLISWTSGACTYFLALASVTGLVAALYFAVSGVLSFAPD